MKQAMLNSLKPGTISISVEADSAAVADSPTNLKFLQFQIGVKDRALLKAEMVTEIITVPKSEILPVPQMPHCVMGVYSWRSEMLWLIDLENFLGYPPASPLAKSGLQLDTLMVMVLQVQGQFLGLVVPQVNDIVQRDMRLLQTPSAELFSRQLLPFMQGYFTDGRSEFLILLKAETILGPFRLAASEF